MPRWRAGSTALGEQVRSPQVTLCAPIVAPKSAAGTSPNRLGAAFPACSGGTRVATQWLMKLELRSILALLLSGCALGPTIADAAKARGAADLSCASEHISVDGFSGGVVIVRGCGAWTQYTCFYSGNSGGRYSRPGDPVCVTDAPARVFPDTNVEPAESVEPNEVARSHQPANAGVSKHGNMCIGQGCYDTAHADRNP